MRESKAITSRNKRVHDFPELQVGFPERNDVTDPNIEMEGIDVDLKTSGAPAKTTKPSYGKSGEQTPVTW